MWMFCCGMPRTGSTLQYQIAAQLVEETNTGKRLTFYAPEDFVKARSECKNYKGHLVFKAHRPSVPILEEFQAGNAIGIMSVRDIRDVIVSFMKKEQATFREVWTRHKQMQGFLGHFFIWTQFPRVLVSRYEDTFQKLPREVRRTAKHIGLKVKKPLVKKIARDLSIESQLEITKNLQENPESGRQMKAFQGSVMDDRTLLHSHHISESLGQSTWKKVLKPQEVELIEKKFDVWLKLMGYPISTISYK